MSQITRCPSCATMFKVVADQLRISEGWVRCGHCQQVFDASAHLQPLQPPAMMPDMALDQLRSPPQPVPRAALAARAWGAPASRHAPAVEPQRDSRPLAAEQHGHAAETDPTSTTLEVPESTVPAFLAAGPAPADPGENLPDRTPAPFPPLVGVEPSEVPAERPSVMDWPAIERPPELPSVVPSAGYELPAPVLDEDDGEIDPDPFLAESEFRAPESSPATQEQPADGALQEELEAMRAARTQSHDAALPWQSAAEADQTQPPPDLAGQEEAASLEVQALPDGSPDPQHLAPTHAAPGDHALVDAGVVEDPPEQDDPAAQPVDIEPAATNPVPADALAGELSFVRAARRKAFWRKTPVRISLVLLGLLLLCGLLLQTVVHERSVIAATWPASRPYLEQLCAPLQCQVGPYRQIAAVVVDGSTFHKTRGDSYQFSLTLKNQSQTRVEMPAIELTLTDAQDQPVLRRVLTPQDLAAPAELSAQGEWNFSASLWVNLGSTRITGYRVLAFYP